MTQHKTCPCKTCGTPTEMLGTQLCNNCWEVERRIDDYARSEAGQAHLATLLRKHGYRVIKTEGMAEERAVISQSVGVEVIRRGEPHPRT